MGNRLKQKEEKKERIVQAAAGVFAKKGYNGANVANIAAEAGVGKGTVYEYFDSKDDLYFAVFEWFMERVAGDLAAKIATLGGSAEGRLTAMTEAFTSFGGEVVEFFGLTMEFWSASASSPQRDRFMSYFRQAYVEIRVMLATLIEDGQARGEFRKEVDAAAVAAVVVGALDGLYLQAWFDPDFKPADAGKKFSKVLIRGLLV